MQTLKTLGAVMGLAIFGTGFAIDTYNTAIAQTLGMERRAERRHTRQESRAVKWACKAGDQHSNAECRHMKHEVKQSGRYGTPVTTPVNTITPPPH